MFNSLRAKFQRKYTEGELKLLASQWAAERKALGIEAKDAQEVREAKQANCSHRYRFVGYVTKQWFGREYVCVFCDKTTHITSMGEELR